MAASNARRVSLLRPLVEGALLAWLFVLHPGDAGGQEIPVPVSNASCMTAHCELSRSGGRAEAEPTFLWATYGIGATNGMAWILGGSLQRTRHVLSLRMADTYEAGVVDAGLLYGRVLWTAPLHVSASTGIGPVFGRRVSTTVGIPLEVQVFLRRRAVGFGVYGFGNLNPEESFVGLAVSVQGGRLPHE